MFETGKIYIYTGHTDWRLRIDGLSTLARAMTGISVRDEDCWMVFFKKDRKSVRILHHTPGRIILYEQRLNGRGSKFPEVVAKALHGLATISREELRTMLGEESTSLNWCAVSCQPAARSVGVSPSPSL